MAYEFISVRREGRVMVLTIERPDVMNALHSPAHFECDDAFNTFAADRDLWIAVVTGAGDKAFSAGNDLKHHASGGSMAMPPSGFGGLSSRFDLDKPIIAAVNGLALGGGFEVALACDVIVASSNATFGLPEPKVGLAALAGGLHRLPRAIGVKRAMAMILTAARISAEDGRALGFVHEVVAEGGALNAALTMAKTMEQCSPASLRASKQAVLRGFDLPLAEALKQQREWPAIQALLKSPDAREGPRAFAEKRPPNWASS